MKKFIIITTIQSPTDAVAMFGRLAAFKTVVVADKKTPAQWECPNTKFLSVEEQLSMNSKLAARLPWNHYARKMLGYIYSITQGADVIVDADDDNYSKQGWGFPPFEGDYLEASGSRYLNIYSYFTKEYVWPRGFPVELLHHSAAPRVSRKVRQSLGVWQSLADEDPDVDAIYRMVFNRSIVFDIREPVVIAPGTVVPFNSQNTAFRKEVFPLLYLPTSVTFRFTDILRSLVAQPILWLCGYRLGFSSATVTQKRNKHDLLDDFVSEVPMYANIATVVEIAESSTRRGVSIATNMLSAYKSLVHHGIVAESEIECLESWLEDIGAV